MMSLNAFILPLSLHKMLRSDGKPTFSPKKTVEKMSSVIMKAIDNIISKKARIEGLQRLDNVRLVFGRNWKPGLKLYLLPLLFHHLHDLCLLPMQMTFLRSGI